MKRGISLAAAGLLAGTFAFAGVGLAQQAPPEHPQVEITSVGAPTTDLPMAEYRAFDQFSSDHPEIVRQLSRNPRLMRSRSYQAKNPALRELFDNHPQLQTAMEENPGNFLPLAPGAGTRHHVQRHHQTMKSKSAASHTESSTTSESSGASGTAGNATASPGENPSSPAGGGNGAASPGAGSSGSATSNGAGGGTSSGGGNTSGGSGSM